MLNFNFQNTTRIHFGEGQIKTLNDSIPKTAKILVTYGGGSIKMNGKRSVTIQRPNQFLAASPE
jgi:NADP-dependent alcohol dehydrogenase